MISKKMMLAGGAIAALGIAYLMTAGGSEESGGSGGGGGLNMPGQGVSMGVPQYPGEIQNPAPMTYSINIPETPAVPSLPQMPAMTQPSLSDIYGGAKKSSVVSGIPVSAPGGKTTYAYGVSGFSEAQAAQSASIATAHSAGAAAAGSGRTSEARSAFERTESKKDGASKAAGVGIGAGLSGAFGSIGSAIGGLFGW